VSHFHNSRNHVLVCPPFVPVYGGWEGAAGSVAKFRFLPRFFEAVADQLGLPLLGVKGLWHDFFAIDLRLEALCWLLMEETEAQCPHGPLYFEPLARALAAGVLSTIRDKHLQKRALRRCRRASVAPFNAWKPILRLISPSPSLPLWRS
jgi:hypothetical protein